MFKSVSIKSTGIPNIHIYLMRMYKKINHVADRKNVAVFLLKIDLLYI